MAALVSDWLRHFRLLWRNRWTESKETWQEARSQGPLPSLCFSGGSEKEDGRPGFWLAETFSTTPLQLLNGIQRNLIGGKISTPSTKFVFFGADRKNKMAALVSDWLRHFRLLWRNPERNSSKLDRKQALNAFYHVCVFQANRGKKQNGRPGLWLAETFSTSPLKPLKGIRRNLIGSKISTPSTKFVFFRWIGKTKWPPPPGLWFAETFSTFPLKPLNRIQQNLTGSKISTSSTRLAFFGLIRKTR